MTARPAPQTGIIRPARRPDGWNAPGPRPAAPLDRPELWPGPGEDLCFLAGDWRILQRLGGHRWSLDDLVTAWFAAEQVQASPPALIADLGCGIGTVLLLLSWRFPMARGIGIEIQGASVALARRSLRWNGAEGRCEVRRGDLRDRAMLPEDAVFDLVTATPPYLPPGSATEPADPQRRRCHVEEHGGIEAYCLAAARLLSPDGVFVTCAGAAQAARVEVAAAGAGLVIERRRDVVPRAGKAALFGVYAIGCRAPEARPVVEPALVVRDRRGRRTDGFRQVRSAMGMPP
jgi:tRNA1Val (adenine37-N6)-methyltransferase